jgi:hypothetical protein
MRAVRVIGAGVAALGIAASAAAPSQAWTPGPSHTNVSLARIHYEARGAGLNGEYVKLTNHHSYPVDLRGWSLTETYWGHRYVFPDKWLAPGASVWLYSGRGRDAGANLYWFSSGWVWHEGGDGAVLRNGRGTVIDTCGWKSRGAGWTDCN